MAAAASPITPAALLEDERRLRAQVAQHKSAIRRHREQLHDAKAALARLAAQCRELGIHFSIQE